jgi:hypothetical protein
MVAQQHAGHAIMASVRGARAEEVREAAGSQCLTLLVCSCRSRSTTAVGKPATTRVNPISFAGDPP